MITIMCKAALPFLQSLPDKSVDILLTDPPYNLAPYAKELTFSWRESLSGGDSWDAIPFYPQYYQSEIQRVLKPKGTVFAFTTYNLIGIWHSTFDPLYDTFQMITWHKTNPPPKIRRQGFLNACEHIVCFWNKGHIWNFSKQNEMHNFIEGPICMGKERLRGKYYHRNQKPLYLLSKILSWVSFPGAIVCDPFMGVGSTGVAALRAGCSFWGCNITPLSVEATEMRLSIEERRIVA